MTTETCVICSGETQCLVTFPDVRPPRSQARVARFARFARNLANTNFLWQGPQGSQGKLSTFSSVAPGKVLQLHSHKHWDNKKTQPSQGSFVAYVLARFVTTSTQFMDSASARFANKFVIFVVRGVPLFQTIKFPNVNVLLATKLQGSRQQC